MAWAIYDEQPDVAKEEPESSPVEEHEEVIPKRGSRFVSVPKSESLSSSSASGDEEEGVSFVDEDGVVPRSLVPSSPATPPLPMEFGPTYVAGQDEGEQRKELGRAVLAWAMDLRRTGVLSSPGAGVIAVAAAQSLCRSLGVEVKQEKVLQDVDLLQVFLEGKRALGVEKRGSPPINDTPTLIERYAKKGEPKEQSLVSWSDEWKAKMDKVTDDIHLCGVVGHALYKEWFPGSEGVRESKEKGMQLLRKAAEKEDAFARQCCRWFELVSEEILSEEEQKVDPEDGLRMLARQGNAFAAWALALEWVPMINDGTSDVGAKMSKGFVFLRQAAEAGIVPAMFRLAVCLETGKGCDMDVFEAARWYNKAVVRGHCGAMAQMGWCWERGCGVDKRDAKRAAEMYRRAIALGHAGAMLSLGILCQRGEGVEQSDEEAVRWFKLASEQDVPMAHFHLGNALIAGRGIKRDPTEAARLFVRAAQGGVAQALANLATLQSVGVGTNRDDQSSRVLMARAAQQQATTDWTTVAPLSPARSSLAW